MSKNVVVNGQEYTAVSRVQLKTTNGGTAIFKDEDEITTPSGSVTITENGTHNVANYAQAVVNVKSEEAPEDETYKNLLVNAFNGTLSGDVVLPDAVNKLPANIFSGCKLTSIKMDGVKYIGSEALYNNTSLVLTELPPNIETIKTSAFAYCKKVAVTRIPASLIQMDGSVFNQSGTKELTFLGTPTSLHSGALVGVDVVNVPWAEGAVAGAPWGAKTINYNHTGA